MPVTLLEMKVGMADKVQAQVIDTFVRHSELLELLPFDDAVSPSGGSTLTYGYVQKKLPSTTAFRAINSEYSASQATVEKKTVDLKVFDKKVLYSFTPLPHYSWIKEGISASSMRKFNISYDIEMNRIIIPHMDINNNLVGIRARNLDEYAVDTFGKYTPIRYKGVDYRYPTGENLYGININKENIKKYKKIILFEAEKSVLFMDTYYDDAFAVAVNGSMLTDTQIGLIASLGVDEVIVAFDKEFEVVNDKESVRYAQKLSSMLDRLKSRYNVSIIWDTEGLLDKKDSPADRGKEVFDRLYNGRIKI